MDIPELRAQLDQVDKDLVRLAAERQRIVAEIGRSKRGSGRPLRDFRREKEVLDNVRGHAREAGIDPELAAGLMQLLINASLTRQEQDTVRALSQGGGRRALVIGGSGRMGAWFARFLDAQGFQVEVADPVANAAGFAQRERWDEGGLEHDLIVVATPLRAAARILAALAEKRPPGIVFDLGSIKTPLRGSLAALKAAGVRATSIHPLFGPSANVLAGRHVVLIDCGDRAALEAARALFASTTAITVEMDLDEHDRVIALVLGLSHAVNIAFTAALAGSGVDSERLKAVSSTTFGAQLGIAEGVARENPHLYFEIQSLNAHNGPALTALDEAVHTLLAAVRNGDEDSFVSLMQQGRDYLHAPQE
ncbi:prephenate dehydrogenase/arogenate dehydrogenase family protein [Tahibacter harae]|uniref:chorismate mutase n=1 Tax=Tahibacter harae TaxID=2963937 RepID=A0ABT1QNB4_9GAMM|nr:prephenate dehydrogenase/arogenate dehydrogenase family protein [Tahibacter harae]MCQ4164014.1 prephenate dehydrogenase/arogenate dehydrogenase family protein [Tahibacter harae]